MTDIDVEPNLTNRRHNRYDGCIRFIGWRHGSFFPLRIANRGTALEAVIGAKNPRDTRWSHTHIRVPYINLFLFSCYYLLFYLL